MSKDIYDNDENLQLSESADIYSPHTYKVKGKIDKEQYEILVNERPLPEGIPPAPPVIDDIVEWDEEFFITWSSQGSPLFDISVTEDDSSVVDIEDVKDKSMIISVIGLQNNIQYEAQLEAEIVGIFVQSNKKSFTLQDVVPISDLSLESVSEGSITVSWSGISIADSYNVYREDAGGNILASDNTNDTTHQFTGVSQQEQSIYVTAVSKYGIFESGESNIVRIYSLKIFIDETTSQINAISIPESDFIAPIIDETTSQLDTNSIIGSDFIAPVIDETVNQNEVSGVIQ